MMRPSFVQGLYCCAGWLAGVFVLFGFTGLTYGTAWGFYAHRLINRMAVFTLPPDLIGLYKTNIEYITAHAVDPDKRRYATRYEAVRHYIDLDHWDQILPEAFPKTWANALSEHLLFYCIHSGDTMLLGRRDPVTNALETGLATIDPARLLDLVRDTLMKGYYDDPWLTSCQVLQESIPELDCNCEKIIIREHFSEHGILPYHLMQMQRRLTQAFECKNGKEILRLSADFGHYIADACVPLHTTENYNGQLTGQTGIHAFWESRIPELFAEEYDFLTGRAVYLNDPQSHYWKLVLESHALVADVLALEKALSQQYPSDEQFCFDERLEISVRTQCRDYAAAYQKALAGMVENRMRAAIHATGSAWYTAWVDAGQPDMKAVEWAAVKTDTTGEASLKRNIRAGRQLGRKHE